MKKLLTLSLFVFACGGTTGYVPQETSNPTCQGLPGVDLIGQVCMSEDGCDFYWHCLTDVDQKPIVVCDGRQSASSCTNDAGSVDSGVANSCANDPLQSFIGKPCWDGLSADGGVIQATWQCLNNGMSSSVQCKADCEYPATCPDAGNCGPECTGSGLYDSCTGVWADCVTSLENCPLWIGTPLSCQNGNVCYQPSGVSWKPDFAVNCVAGDGFTWKDDAGQYSCEDYTCPSGANCTTINAAGVTLTGTCL